MTHLASAQLQVQGLLTEVVAQRTAVHIAGGLSAKEAQDLRLDMLRKIGNALDELYAVRDAKQLAAEGQMHVYKAMIALARLRELYLANASLDEIQGMLEDADAEISQAQSAPQESRRRP